MGTNLVLQSEYVVNAVTGETDELAIYRKLRPLCDEQILIGVLGYIKDGRDAPDSRLVTFAGNFIRQKFSYWPPSVNGDHAQRVEQMLKIMADLPNKKPAGK